MVCSYVLVTSFMYIEFCVIILFIFLAISILFNNYMVAFTV